MARHMHALHVVWAVLGFSESSSNQTLALFVDFDR